MKVRIPSVGRTWAADGGCCHPWPYSWGLAGRRSLFRYLTVTSRAGDFELERVPIASWASAQGWAQAPQA